MPADSDNDNDNDALSLADIDQDEHPDGPRDTRLHHWIAEQCRYKLLDSTPLSEFRTDPSSPHQSSEDDDAIRADSPLLGFGLVGEEHEQLKKDDSGDNDGGEVDNASRDPLHFPSPGYMRDLPKEVVLAATRDKPLPVTPSSSAPSSHHGHGHFSTHSVVTLPPSFTRLSFHPKPAASRLSQQQLPPAPPQPTHTRNPSSSSSGCSAIALAARASPAISRRPSLARQPSLQLLGETSILQIDTSPAPTPTPLPTTSVIRRSRSVSSASLASLFHLPTGFGLDVTSPSASSPSPGQVAASSSPLVTSPLPAASSPTRRQSRIHSFSSTLSLASSILTPESSSSSPAGPAVNIAPSQSGGGYLRNAVYIDSDEVRARLDELLLAASTSASGTIHHGKVGGGKAPGVFDEDEEDMERGEVDELIGGYFDSSHGHSGSPTEENVSSNPILHPLSISSAPPTSTWGVPPNTPMMGYYTTPYASSSQVYLGTDALHHSSSHHLLPSSVALPPLPTDAQAPTRPVPAPPLPLELAMVIGESASPSPVVPPLSILLDTASASAPSSEEDHSISSPPPSASTAFFPVMDGRGEDTPLTSPATSSFSKHHHQGPYQGLAIPGDDGKLSAANPAMSRWSLTSSTMDEEFGASASKDRSEKEKEHDSKESKRRKSFGLGTKRNRLASFISMLSATHRPALPLSPPLPPCPSYSGIYDSVSASAGGTRLRSNSSTILNASWEHNTSTITRAGTGLGSASQNTTPTLSLVTTPCDTVPSTPLSDADEEKADYFRRVRSEMEMGALVGERDRDEATVTRSSVSNPSSPLSSSPTSPFGLAVHHHQHHQGDRPQLKSMASLGSLSALAHQHGQQVGRAAVAAVDSHVPHGQGSISRGGGLRGLVARMGLISSLSHPQDSVSSSRTRSSTDPLPYYATTTTTTAATISKRTSMDSKSIKSLKANRKGPKRYLTVSGINEDDDGEAMDAVRAWCESFGEVKKMERTKKGVLVVDWRKASVADTVCRIHAQVVIKGAGTVAISWSTKKT